MSERKLPWFRLYSEAVDDEKLRLLSFEDRWHFIAILCCKNQGILDSKDPLLRRKIAVKLGLAQREFDEAARRISEVGLIDYETLQPPAWDDRQMVSDSSSSRVKAYRERMKQNRNVTVTAQDTDADTEHTPISPKGEVAAATVGQDRKSGSAKLNIPYDSILQAYRDALPELSQPDLLTDHRKKSIAARWKQLIGTKDQLGRVRYSGIEDGIAWWCRLFGKVRKNPHWMGNNERSWAADFDWIMGPKNFVKVLEWRPVEAK